MTPTRRFRLDLPAGEGATGAAVALDIEAPASLLIPKQLQAGGLAAYEPETLACFLACIEASPPGVVLDIGANVGVFAWLAARVGGRDAIAFEPTPEVAACAASIAEKNRLAVTVEPIALGAEPGTAQLHLSGTSDLSNSTRAGFRPAERSIDVEMDTVDGLCLRRSLQPSVVKIDTESTEPDVLRGAAEVLAKRRPWIICEVLGASTEAKLEKILAPHDYVWFQITHESPLVARREIFGDRTCTYRNWLFAPTIPGPEFWQSMRRWTEALRGCLASSVKTEVVAPALRFGGAPPKLDFWQSMRRRTAALRGRLASSSKTELSASFIGALPDLGWQPLRAPRFEAVERDGSVAITSSLQAGIRLLFFHGLRDLGAPDLAPLRIPISPTARYEVRFDVHAGESETLGFHLFANQYDETRRIHQGRLWVQKGANAMIIEAEQGASSLRLAFRISGPGKFIVGPIKLYRIDG